MAGGGGALEHGVVAITGATGFLSGRLRARLEASGVTVVVLPRDGTIEEWAALVAPADAVAHLAGVTKADRPEAFEEGNTGLTHRLTAALATADSRAAVLFASSVRVGSDTAYGRTKAAAERVLLDHSAATGAPVAIFRLPQFFGEGARPHYNSIVATILADAAGGRRTELQQPASALELVRVEDVVDALVAAIRRPPTEPVFGEVAPVHRTTVGEVARIAWSFHRGERDIGSADPALVAGLRATFDAWRRQPAA